MKKLIFFVLVCEMMYSCGNEHHYLAKIPDLKTNDIIYFQNIKDGITDTFQLNVKNIMHQDMVGDYFQYVEIYYNKIKRKEVFWQINIGPSGGIIDNEDYTIENYYNYTQSGIRMIKTNFILNGITYPKVYVDSVYSDKFPDTIPNTAYFTYQNGIIRYEYKDGRVYNLVSK
jgi:hypothetical protein